MALVSFYPFNGKRGRLRLGLHSINFSDWIHYEDDFVSRIHEKQNLIKECGKQVLDALPGTISAQQEFLNLLLENLKQYHADKFSISENKVFNKLNNKHYELKSYEACPLELASYLAVDDYCLLQEDNEDFRLVAASVCAPTWWNLSEKMNKPLTSIHSPIANLEEKVGRMIRHFFQNLSVTDCYQRSNWFLFTSNKHCVFPDSFDFNSEMVGVDEDNIETSLFLRTERQTFRRLKYSNTIVFGIKVYLEPISIIKDYPAIAEDLLVALNTMDIEQKQSLGINLVEKSLDNYLQKVLAE